MEWLPEEEVETAMPVAIIPASILLSTPSEIFHLLEQVPIREDTITMPETNVYANRTWKQFLLDHLITSTTEAQLLRQNPSIYKEILKKNILQNPQKTQQRGKKGQSVIRGNTQEIRNTYNYLYIKYSPNIFFFSKHT